MKRLFRSKKALSPVVAAIILIAVTVAVSIAVAAWMGALTFTFMKTEELKITNVQFSAGTITLSVKNPGTSAVTINSVRVNDVAVSTTITGALTWAAGDSHDISFSYSYTAGNAYKFALVSSTGTPVAAYEATA